MATPSTASRSPYSSFTAPHSPDVPPLPSQPQTEHRGLPFWMDRVLQELDHVRKSPDPDAVHDLRVAIRRCRSVAAVMEEVDPDPSWIEMRNIARKLFRALGELRDTQVAEEWIRKLGADVDAMGAQLLFSLQSQELRLRDSALRVAAKFDEKTWKDLKQQLRRRARLVPAGSLVAECLTVERYEEAKDLHSRALRTEKTKPWHALRIGVKRFRYTVENLLPNHYAAWSANLKRLQDLLGEIHDLDVLADLIKDAGREEISDSPASWTERIAQERRNRMETYRQLTLGRTSLWTEWRQQLPQGERLDAAVTARLRATGRAADPHPRRTAQVGRIAVSLLDILRRLKAAPVLDEKSVRRVFLGAARLHGVGNGGESKSSEKNARKFLLGLAIPPRWTAEEWEQMAWTVRFHRGEEPKEKSRGFAKLAPQQQTAVRTLAGILRLARALRKCGVDGSARLRGEKSVDAIILQASGLTDTSETAARLAAGKHLLESTLDKPLILKPGPKVEKIVALPPQSAAPAPVLPAASD
jgi:CHAD domain-containing protein